MKTLILAAMAAALLGAVPASAKDKLSYLSAVDSEAVAFFKCAATVEAVRENLLADGYDAYTSLPGTFDKAGRAAVIKASLLAEEYEAKPKVKKISFTSAKAEKLVTSDIAVHRAIAAADLDKTSFAGGFDALASCTTPSRLDSARAAVDWLDNDVALFEPVK